MNAVTKLIQNGNNMIENEVQNLTNQIQESCSNTGILFEEHELLSNNTVKYLYNLENYLTNILKTSYITDYEII